MNINVISVVNVYPNLIFKIIDCLDGSDEVDNDDEISRLINKYCIEISTFRCQERSPRRRLSFSCGDGQYLVDTTTPIGLMSCSNRRDFEFGRRSFSSFEHISDFHCRKSFSCALYRNRRFAHRRK